MYDALAIILGFSVGFFLPIALFVIWNRMRR